MRAVGRVAGLPARTAPDALLARWLGLTAMSFTAVVVLFPFERLRLELGGTVSTGVATAALLGIQAYAALRGLHRVRDMARWAFWGVLISALYVLPMYAVARAGLPFRDALLRAADARTGVDVAAIVAFTRAHPWADRISTAAYESLPIGCIAALIVPPLAGSGERTRTLLGALALASVATLAFYRAFRGIGPWEGYARMTPTMDQRACADACRALAAGGWFVVDLQRPDPLIAFPSWHALLAALSAMALARLPRARVAAWVWGSAVALSTLTTGWHYAVDTIAGLALAAGCWALAKTLARGRGGAGR